MSKVVYCLICSHDGGDDAFVVDVYTNYDSVIKEMERLKVLGRQSYPVKYYELSSHQLKEN